MHYLRPRVSYVVPAFNEAAFIEAHLDEIYRYARSIDHEYPFEIHVVDDGSTDETGVLAEAFAAVHPRVSVHHHLFNRGLARALRTGFANARGDIVIPLDLDLSYEPSHIERLLAAHKETGAAIVLASPYTRGGEVKGVPWQRKQMSAWANRYLSLATGGRLSTLTCMVRAYDTAGLRQLRIGSADLDYNHRTVLSALREGLSVIEVPAQLHWRRPTEQDRQLHINRRMLAHVWSVLQSGIRHRPSLLFAVPGLIPGLLPLVLAVLALLHLPQPTVVLATVTTIAIQVLSMAYAAVLAGTYLRKMRAPSRSFAFLTDGKTESRA